MTDASIEINRHGIGGNLPPAPTPYEQARLEISDLYLEATNWCDGSGVNTAAEEAEVDKLLDMLRAARKAADTSRKLENEPFDTGKAEVQARYNPILSKADLAADACKKALAPFRQRIADEKAKVAEAARLEAEAKRKIAEEAIRSSRQDDLTQREAAEAMLKDAKKADAFANRSEKAATTGLGLRKRYHPELVDQRTAITHYWVKRRAEVLEFLLDLARKDIAAGQQDIPGFNIVETKVAV